MQRKIDIRKALTQQDFDWAADLRARVYHASGYLPKQKLMHKPSLLEVGDTKSDDVVYLTEVTSAPPQVNRVVGTVSLTLCEATTHSAALESFPTFLQSLSVQWKQFLFVGSLAVLPEFRHHRGVVLGLLQATVVEAIERRVERAVCVVHPKHVSFYTSCLGFTQVDQCENMPGLINAPAILLEATVAEVVRRFSRFKKGVHAPLF